VGRGRRGERIGEQGKEMGAEESGTTRVVDDVGGEVTIPRGPSSSLGKEGPDLVGGQTWERR